MRKIAGSLFLTLLITSILVFAGVSPSAAGGCYAKKWAGKHCVAIHYEVESESYGKVPAKLHEQMSIFKNIAHNEELDALKVETNKYNVNSNDNAMTIDGWILYELASPKQAVKFIDVLTALGYETIQHEQKPGCGY